MGSVRVPQVLEVGTAQSPSGASIWLREQRIAGESLRARVGRGPIPIADIRQLTIDILEALADAERARIVHRDVKPDNIMCATDGRFWLLDFGIARHLDLQSLTATALGGPGTIGYAPPEQYRNRKRELDSRADLFALAVTIVECLTGRHPYRDGARDQAEVVRRIEASPLLVPVIPTDASGKFRDLISAMGQRRVDPRPQGAAVALDWMKEVRREAGE